LASPRSGVGATLNKQSQQQLQIDPILKMKLVWPKNGEWDLLIENLRDSVFHHPLKYKLFPKRGNRGEDEVLEIKLRNCKDLPRGVQTATKLLILDQNDEWFQMDDLLDLLGGEEFWPNLKGIEIKSFQFPEIQNKVKLIYSNYWGLAEKLLYGFQFTQGAIMWTSRDIQLLHSAQLMERVGIAKFTFDVYKIRKKRGQNYQKYKDELFAQPAPKMNRFWVQDDIISTTAEGERIDPILNLNHTWGAHVLNWEKKIPTIVMLCPDLPEHEDLKRLSFLTPNLICLMVDNRTLLKVQQLPFKEHLQFFLREPSDLAESGEVEIDLIGAKLQRWQWFAKRGGNKRDGNLVGSQKKIKISDG